MIPRSLRGKRIIWLATALAVPLILFALLSALFPLPPFKPYSLVVEDRHGMLLHAYRASDGQWRLRTDPAEIPDRLVRILLRREDRWFYVHPGVNPFALLRAAWQNVRAGHRVSGGSTITMQLARLLEPKRRTVGAKVIEIFRALQLEVRYSKRELLEMYLSTVPLGGNIEGLKSAALLYYETPPERLNIARLFDLILIPRSPSRFQPDRHPELLMAERRRQAARWVAAGLLTSADSTVLATTPAGVFRASLPRRAPHFCLRVREERPQGGDVKSSLDLRTQEVVEGLLASHLHGWSMSGVRNGAVLVVDNATREVLAYAGSGDFNDAAAAGQVDAVRALRSPGSTLKPLLYAMLMDAGTLTPKSRLLDIPYDAEGFSAENYDGTYAGLVTADDALRRSLNVPMVRLLKTVGTSAFVQFAAHAGVRSLQAQKPRLGLSMILGGCGVTLEELVTAYASLPNNGTGVPLRFLAGQPAAPNEQWTTCSPAAAFMVTTILTGLNRPDLPNGFESSLTLPAIAFKTGTSYGRRDAWAIGYTASHTVGVWLGNADNSGNPDLVGGKTAAPLLVDILNAISTSRAKSILPAPADVSMRMVCAESGQDPTPQCARVVEDFCSTDRTQRTACTTCREYLVSPDGMLTYCPSCLGTHPTRSVTLPSYPPELLDFWNRGGIAYRTPPPHNPACTTVLPGDGPAILSPSANMTYFMTNGSQRLSLQAAPLVDVATHAWYMDDEYLGKVRAGQKYLVRLRPGTHVISCVDDRGRVGKVTITVINAG